MSRLEEDLIKYVDLMDKTTNLTIEENTIKYKIERDNGLSWLVRDLYKMSRKEDRLEAVKNYINRKEELTKDTDKLKDSLNKVYGIKLDSIDFLKLESGIDVIAFYDENYHRKRIIDYSYAKSLTEEFTNKQNNNNIFQSQDYEANSVAIAKQEALENEGKRELDMIDVETFKKEFNDRIRELNDPIKIQNIKKIYDTAIMPNSNIKYVNIENMIALDDKNNIIESYYDEKTNQSVIESPVQYRSTVEYVDNKENVENDEYNTSGELSSNNPVENNNTDITPTDFEKEIEIVNAEELELDFEMRYHNFIGNKKEIMDNIKKFSVDMSKLYSDPTITNPEEIKFYEDLTNKYCELKKRKEKEKRMNNTKTLVKKLTNPELGNAAFVNIILISIVVIFLAFVILINL